MSETRILPLTLAVCVALSTFSYFAIQCIAHRYVDRFWATRSNGGRCMIAQDGARFMRDVAMFAHADQMDRLGEISCLAHFRQETNLKPRPHARRDPACNG